MAIMTPPFTPSTVAPGSGRENTRLDYLDATRAFALVLGVVFHSSLSFTPAFIGWAVQDVSTGPLIGIFMTVSHCFRMETFFLLAGFLSRVTFHRRGAREFIRSRSLRITVPFGVGWFVLHPLMASGWIMGSASLRGPVDVRAALLGGFQTLSSLPAGIFTGSHLWFLYYLAMITTLALAARGAVIALGLWRVPCARRPESGSEESSGASVPPAPGASSPRRFAGGTPARLGPGTCATLLQTRSDAVMAWIVDSRFSLGLLAVPTAAALWFMRSWGMDTPDRSLLPDLPVLAIYGGFFVFGWMLSRRHEWISRFTRLTPERWFPGAVGLAAVLILGRIERDPGHPHYVAAHVAYDLGYAAAMWSLVSLSIGAFGKWCPRPDTRVRYVADSSYWMYLIHLPAVIWLQVAVAEVPLHWSIKLAFVSVLTIAISLLTYDLFVRATWIGRVLNGRRRDGVIAPWLLRGIRNARRGKPRGAMTEKGGETLRDATPRFD